MKNLLKIILALALIGGGVWAYFHFTSQQEATEIVVETVKVERGSITEEISATGTIEPITQVEVGTQVSGVVEKVYVDFNSVVKKGQLIAELDKTNLKAAVAEATTNLSTAQNELDYLQLLFDRKEALYKGNNSPKADYEEALYKLNAAKNTISQRKSELSRAQTNLGFANIYSPINGVVLSKDVNVGQTVAASFSTPTLFTIAQDLSKMQLEADVDEADVGGVKEGQRVTFTVDAFPDETFSGEVTQLRLNPTTTSSVVTYTVVIRADNPDLKLLPGLTATVSIFTYEKNDVLTLAAKALNFKPDMALMMKYKEPPAMDGKQPELDGQPQKNGQIPAMPAAMKEPANENEKVVWAKKGEDIVPTTVTIGKGDGINVEIIDGLEEGQEVVFSMKETGVTDGMQPSGGGQMDSPFMPKPPGRR